LGGVRVRERVKVGFVAVVVLRVLTTTDDY